MLSGGTCWSLWERLGVLDDADSGRQRDVVIQLNLEGAGSALFASAWPAARTGGVRKGRAEKTRASAKSSVRVCERQRLCVRGGRRGRPSCC